jgi:sec-independent protein translocase protein TatC
MAEGADLNRRRLQWLRRRRRKAPRAMTVLEHLGELRSRLIVAGLAFLALSVAAFIFYEPILELIREPYCRLPADLQGPQGCDFIYTNVLGAFQFRLKLTALAGIALAAPVWLYEIWAFIVPAFTPREKRYAVPFFLSSVALFAIGALFAYVTLPTAIRVLVGLGGEDLDPFIGAEQYLNFIGLMLLGFGLMFEMPLLLLFLGLVEVINVDQLRRGRRVALVGIVAVAAVVTPSQDPYTLLVLSLPLYLLYEVTILLLRRIERRRERAHAAGPEA